MVFKKKSMTHEDGWELSGGLGFHLGQQHLVLAALLEGKQKECVQRGGGYISTHVRLRWSYCPSLSPMVDNF